jgi:hypothetical protein
VADPYAEYGGREHVANAWQVAEALKTELGVRTMIQQGLLALGYSADQIKAALGDRAGAPVAPAAAPADPYADLSDDDIVTGAQLKQYLAQQSQAATAAQQAAIEAAQQAAAAQVDPIKAQFEAQRNAAIIQRNDATLTELLGPPPADAVQAGDYQAMAQGVLAAASRYIQPDNWDPAHIRAAIVQGHADVVARQEAQFQAYLGKKREAKRAAPANIGGQSAGEAPAKEPQTMKEARELARSSGIFD